MWRELTRPLVWEVVFLGSYRALVGLARVLEVAERAESVDSANSSKGEGEEEKEDDVSE